MLTEQAHVIPVLEDVEMDSFIVVDLGDPLIGCVWVEGPLSLPLWGLTCSQGRVLLFYHSWDC